jgi:hypothetical protein
MQRRLHDLRADAVAVRHRDGNILCHDLIEAPFAKFLDLI